MASISDTTLHLNVRVTRVGHCRVWLFVKLVTFLACIAGRNVKIAIDSKTG